LVTAQSAKAQFDDGSDNARPEIKIDKVIFSLGYNTAWRVARTEANNDAEREYFRNLKRGSGFRLKALIPLGDQRSAVGVTYNTYKSKTGMLMGLSEFHQINYIGGVYQQYTKLGTESEHVLSLEYSFGYMNYQSSINGIDAFKGGNIAASVGGAYRYMISPEVGIGLDLHAEGTTINEWTAANGQTFDLGDGDNLFRVSLGLGIDIRL
jgi:hypothetical protein